MRACEAGRPRCRQPASHFQPASTGWSGIPRPGQRHARSCGTHEAPSPTPGRQGAPRRCNAHLWRALHVDAPAVRVERVQPVPRGSFHQQRAALVGAVLQPRGQPLSPPSTPERSSQRICTVPVTRLVQHRGQPALQPGSSAPRPLRRLVAFGLTKPLHGGPEQGGDEALSPRAHALVSPCTPQDPGPVPMGQDQTRWRMLPPPRPPPWPPPWARQVRPMAACPA